MGRTGLLWFAVAAIITVISGCSKTEGTKPASSEQPGGRPGAVGTGGAGANVRSDDDFVRDVALKNMAEIELSRLALDKATNLDIKSFAQTIIDDHSAAGDKLKSVVSGQPIEWPTQLDDKHRKTADELAQKRRRFRPGLCEGDGRGHQDLTAKLESRLDVKTLADWKGPPRAAPTPRSYPSRKTQCAMCKSVPTRATTRSRQRSTSGPQRPTPSPKSTSTPPGGSRTRRKGVQPTESSR